jgi:segregation and condensation protein A
MTSTFQKNLFSEEDSYKTDNFQGPLEMLWTLIEKEELDLERLNLKELCTQLKEKLNKWTHNPPISKASENLYLLASLILLKSRSLLPPSEVEAPLENLSDSRLDFFKHLITYSQIQQLGHFLYKHQINSQKYFTRPLTASKKKYRLLHPEEIQKVLSNMLKKRTQAKPIDKERYSVKKREVQIKFMIKQKKRLALHEIFEKEAPKGLWIVSFLALLELMKQNIICVLTNNTEIWICPHESLQLNQSS